MALVNEWALIMNKNIKIISITAIATITLISFFGFYSAANSSSINPIDTTPVTNNDYFVSTSLKKVAQVAVPAVEAFDTQNSGESTEARNNRLSLYFSGNSPVYNYKLDNLTSGTTKTTSKTIYVESLDSEGSGLNLTVNLKTTSYINDKQTNLQRSYWVKLIKLQDGSLIVYDLGVNK